MRGAVLGYDQLLVGFISDIVFLALALVALGILYAGWRISVADILFNFAYRSRLLGKALAPGALVLGTLTPLPRTWLVGKVVLLEPYQRTGGPLLLIFERAEDGAALRALHKRETIPPEPTALAPNDRRYSLHMPYGEVTVVQFDVRTESIAAICPLLATAGQIVIFRLSPTVAQGIASLAIGLPNAAAIDECCRRARSLRDPRHAALLLEGAYRGVVQL